jgi:hypothetical protein
MNAPVIAAQQERARKQKYVEREEDPELRRLYEQEQQRFQQMQETLKGKIDGEIDMDMHGNVTFKPAQSATDGHAKNPKDVGGI